MTTKQVKHNRKRIDWKKLKLTESEQEIERKLSEMIEEGTLKSVENFDEVKSQLQIAARNTLNKKSKKISLRVKE